MLGSEHKLDLSIPEQTLISLSFVEPIPAKFKAWVDNLPLANVGEASRQLYQAIIEFNKLAMAPLLRTQLLEILRAPIEYVCKELSKHFLNQSVVLPEKQQKIANLAQAIQIHLATGYKIVLVESLPSLSHEKQKKNFVLAAHRLLSEYGQVILRASQLYTATPKNIWLEMNRVYVFAESLNLLNYKVADTQNKYQIETRLDQPYKRNLLLNTSRPNQLRQNDIQVAYNLFELWSDYVGVAQSQADSSVFIINMEQDSTPRYKSLMNNSSPHHYGFDTSDLVERIHEYLNLSDSLSQGGSVNSDTKQPNQILDVPNNVSDILLNHLNQAFGVLTKRSFKRIANEGALNLCIGLSASHYFSSGKVPFHTQMLQSNTVGRESDNNIFLTQAIRKDAWSEAYDGGGRQASTPSDVAISFSRSSDENSSDAYPNYQVPLVNTSPGGYCLQWKGDIPGNIQAGEILSIRDNAKQPWRIAVIRWIRHIKQSGTQIGIELLAPSARPCGVQLLQKTGDPSEYLRGLLLPEISAIGQAATLITPRLPFQSGQKVSIKFADAEGKCQLEKKVFATGSFSQFELSEHAHLKEKDQKPIHDTRTHDNDDDDFDSLWPTL